MINETLTVRNGREARCGHRGLGYPFEVARQTALEPIDACPDLRPDWLGTTKPACLSAITEGNILFFATVTRFPLM
jgi:hypothetical protein